MRNFLVASTVAMFLFSSAAIADDKKENVLGAIAGGALGSTIGKGDGRKAATVLGAILGYRYGDQILNPNHNDRYPDEHTTYYYVPERPRYEYRENRIQNYCRSQVPSRYRIDPATERSWVSGCVARTLQLQAELEAEAYNDGAGINYNKW
jgi:Glycine zipper 2TM domain